jgi:O-antigen ligase
MVSAATQTSLRSSQLTAALPLVREPLTKGFLLLLTVWVVSIFEPHWRLATLGLTPLLKTRLLLMIALTVTLVVGIPMVKAWSDRFHWHVPLLAFMSVAVVNMPWILNRGMAREWLKEWILAWILIVGLVTLVNSVRRSELIMVLYGFGFLWFGLWGAPHGRVLWHHVLSNADGFGAFMVIGLGFSSFMVVALPKGWVRLVMMATAAVCVVGVVSSFARGAFLAAVAIFGLVWLRSPRKGATLAAGVGGALILVVAALVLHGDAFWAEIQSVFEDGTSSGTGADRWALWTAAWQVFEQRPILGAGPQNWGVYAAQFFDIGEVGGRYANNPGTLYNRSLHNMYVQILSEMGIVGVSLFLWILIDFWRRNAALRTAEAARRWKEKGGRMQLRFAAIALELAMVGFLTIAMVYSTAGKHWFFTIQGMNLLLYSHVFGRARPGHQRVPQPRQDLPRRNFSAPLPQAMRVRRV